MALTSPDGTTWTQRTMPSNQTWSNLSWNGTIFCATINGGSIYATSPDGTSWTQLTLSGFNMRMVASAHFNFGTY